MYIMLLINTSVGRIGVGGLRRRAVRTGVRRYPTSANCNLSSETVAVLSTTVVGHSVSGYARTCSRGFTDNVTLNP